MPIHPLITDLLTTVTDWDSWGAGTATLAVGYRLPDVHVEDLAVDGPHGHVAVRLYRPTTRPASGAGLVWAHGGGFAYGDLDMCEAHVVSAELAARHGIVVASVGYRLATPGAGYPIPLDDVDAAWTWFVEAAPSLGVERLGIGGASAGAALTGGVAVRVRDRGTRAPDALLLAYPGMHFPSPALPDEQVDDLRRLPRGIRFLPAPMLDMTRTYLGRLSGFPAEAMAGNGDVAGLPPTSVVLSEVDDLRPSGEMFLLQLQDAGVPTRQMVATGMLHGHLDIPPVPALPVIGESLDFLADALLPG
ncbi:MAG: alpha/beta hydrolase fold domain-containing protein [Cellulomonas sp.]|uniref:alpha/beta hydrolase n=1 Tax=Cellulomonas sp. TaxID=40001 RepID=UPI0019EB60B6|nr:alpha/beta hydrolase fold domain-containing protein [Cellulomonas sp.]MBF0686294.1 alpha/beta hydrolase fold domain-containing protein [Cellulomonas sp.]